MISSLNSNQLHELITNKSVITTTNYSEDDYKDALTRIQMHTYKDPRQEWGRNWRNNLASVFPFVVKLIYKGYNNMLVMPISTHNHKWFNYSFEEFSRYCKFLNISDSCYYGVSYKHIVNGEDKGWRNLDTFVKQDLREDNNKRIGRYIEKLTEIGAISKVSHAYTDLSNNYLYSSKYIISKDKLRDLVTLFTHTFHSTLHTSLSSYLSSSSHTYIHTYTHNLSLSTLGDMFGGVCRNDTVINEIIMRNNEVLPDEEKISYTGRRMYSEVCSYLNEEKHDKIPAGQMTKQMYCDKIFGQNNWFEFDRRGSIYNLTYSLNKKAYLDNDIDIYELMNGTKFKNKEERELFKLTQMSIYFSTARRTISFMLRNLEAKMSAPIPEKKSQLIEAFWKLCNCDERTTWNEFVSRFTKYFNDRKKKMLEVIGDNKELIDTGSKYNRKTYVRNEDSFIFMRESEVYLKFVDLLRQKGLRVVQIYDGFYLEKGSISEEELNKLLKEVVLAESAALL